MRFQIYVTLISCGLFCLFQCNQQKPLQPEENYADLSCPENVISNLEKAYNEQNLEQYLTCFATDFHLVGSQTRWNLAQERQIHENMFLGQQRAKKIILQLTKLANNQNLKTTTIVLRYNYSLMITYQDSSIDDATGQVEFTLTQTGAGKWQITEWSEGARLLKNSQPPSKLDEDYFPLQVGNWWHYEDDPDGFEWHRFEKIIDTTTIDNKKYFIMKGYPLIPDSLLWATIDFYRKDSLNQVWRRKFSEIEPEHILYKLNASRDDKWYFPDRECDSVQVVMYDTLTVRTNFDIFNNCLAYDIACLHSSRISCYLAPGFGVVVSSGVGFLCF